MVDRVPASACALAVQACFALVAVEPVLEPPTSAPGNYNRLAVGHFGTVEEGAVLARATGPEAAWYNPAGLADEHGNTLSGNASLFEFSQLEVEGAGASSEQSALNLFPAFVGGSYALSPGDAARPWVLGLALVTTENWDQSVSLYETRSEAGGERTVSYESSTEVLTLVPTAALAWRPSDEWDIGFQLGLGYTSYDDLRTRNTRLLDGGGAPQETTVTSSRLDLSAWVLRAGVGVRWRPGGGWNLGAVLHSPSVQLAGSGDITFDLFADNAVATASGRVREDDIDVELRSPLSLALGVGYVAPRWELEFDLSWFADPGDYEIFEIGEPLRIDLTPKGGGSTVTVTEPLDATRSSNRATAIVALGGRYRFTEVYHGHAGLSYNASPVDASDDDSAFRDVDLWSIGIGASRNGANVSTVLGLRYSFGEDDSIRVEDLVTGEESTVGLDVALLTVSFSTAYRF